MSWVPLESWDRAVRGQMYRIAPDSKPEEGCAQPGEWVLCLDRPHDGQWRGTAVLMRPDGRRSWAGPFWPVELEEWVQDDFDGPQP